MRKQYDVMLIGTSIGGLVASSLLARQGLQVLVVNQEQIPWEFSYQGYSIERESLLGYGFKRYLFEAIFEELEIRSQEQGLFERSQPYFQVILPTLRLDIFSQRKKLLNEYKREFPKEISAIKEFYKILDSNVGAMETKMSMVPFKNTRWDYALPKLPKNGTSKQHLNQIFSQLKLSPTFQKVIQAQLHFLSNIHSPNPTVAQAAQILCNTHRKDYFFFGKSKDLAQIFYDRIEESGGAIRNDAIVEKLLIDKGRIKGARLSSFEGVVKAKTYIGNVEIHRLLDLLDPKKTALSNIRKLKQLKPCFAKCSFYLGIKRDVIPIKMGSHLVFICDEIRPLLEDNLIFIHVLPPTIDSDYSILHVEFLLPYPQSPFKNINLFSQKGQEIRKKVLENLSWLMPFLKENILFTLPHLTSKKRDQNRIIKSMDLFPLFRGIYDFSVRKKPTEEQISNRTNFLNLFYTGPEVYPFLGFEGETLSSLKTADMALKQIQKMP